MMERFQQTVQSFIDGGGEFICYLCGHTHCDFIAYNSQYPKQLFIVVTCAAILESGDQRRIFGEKCQDAFNIINLDYANKIIKIVRIGASVDNRLRQRNTIAIDISTNPASIIT